MASQQPAPSLLQQVIPKLRPFQREALEFATQGKVYERQCAGDEPKDRQALSSSAIRTSTTLDQSLLGKGRILLADEMGLGKTITSLAIMAYYEAEWPLLILCPASLRYTWPNEIEKFFPAIPPKAVHVVSGFCDVEWTKRPDVRIIVVTYSLLQDRSAVAKVLEDQHFNCIICDESHNLKSKSSQRAKKILPLLRRSRRLVLLSGTPALARPVELWTQLSCLAPKLFGNWTAFTNIYCNPQKKRVGGRIVMDFTGSSNETELHEKLKSIMVRRLKANVLEELPPKQRSIIHTTISREEKENCKQAIKDMGDKRAALGGLFGDEARQADFQAKSKMMKAYQQSGIGKAQAVADYVVDWLAGSDSLKILVFGHHQAVLDTVDQRLLAKCPDSHIRIDGGVPPAIRTQLVRKFQTCARVRVALLSMTAAGVGLTLTAASTVLFAELHWTPGVLAQAEDRAHRIGQSHDSVQVVYMICKDQTLSLDMTMWKMLGKKIGTLGQVVDGSEDKPYIYAAKESVTDTTNEAKSGSRDKSGQEEVSSFFAESTIEESQRKNTPVKGSIQSFFGRAAPEQASTKSAGGDSRPRTAPLRQAFSASKENTDEKASWTCDACTFENSCKSQGNNTWLPCEVCANLHKTSNGINESADSKAIPEIKTACPARKSPPSSTSTKPNTPATLATNDEITWTCHTCTFVNTRTRSIRAWYPCAICQDQRIASDEDLDADSEDDLLNSKPVFHHTPAKQQEALTHSRVASRPARVSNASDVVAIDAQPTWTHQEPRTNFKSPPSESAASSEIIVIDDESEDCTSPVKTAAIAPPNHGLLFSVSKKSGRVTIHFADTGESSLVNFDVEQVVTSDTADRLLHSKVAKRRVTERLSTTVTFDESGVRGVVEYILRERAPRDKLKAYSGELKAFVSDYLSLREVEKKALKDAGRAFPAGRLSQAAAGLMTRSSSGTERYAGGAKERARENLDNGTATSVDKSVLEGRSCAWCAKALRVASIEAESVYCSQACAEEGRLKRGGMFASAKIRAAVFALEGGKCNLCGIDAHGLYDQIRALQPAERLNKLLAVNWKLPKSSRAMENLLNDPNDGDFWQADHIVAVAEGGGGCMLDNLRTLCSPCHLYETEKLRQRLRLKSPPKQDGDTSKRRQVDIRSAFFATKDNSIKRPRK